MSKERKGYFLETSQRPNEAKTVSCWVNIGVAIKSLSGKAITLILPHGKLHISINSLLALIHGTNDYAPIGFLAGDKISSREKRLMRNAFFKIVHHIPQRTHKAFLHSLSEEEKQLLGKKT